MSLIASLVFLTLAVLLLPASAWNIPGHMLSAAIAYQVLQSIPYKGITSFGTAEMGQRVPSLVMPSLQRNYMPVAET